MLDPRDLMQLALDKAREGISRGQAPFGCAVGLRGEVLAVAHNTVKAATDVTAHAEIKALREACRRAGTPHLDGAVVATTCEPCPMCLGALHWARVATVYYGATIDDARTAGLHQFDVAAAELVRLGGSPLRLVPGFLRDDCRDLFARWQASRTAR